MIFKRSVLTFRILNLGVTFRASIMIWCFLYMYIFICFLYFLWISKTFMKKCSLTDFFSSYIEKEFFFLSKSVRKEKIIESISRIFELVTGRKFIVVAIYLLKLILEATVCPLSSSLSLSGSVRYFLNRQALFQVDIHFLLYPFLWIFILNLNQEFKFKYHNTVWGIRLVCWRILQFFVIFFVRINIFQWGMVWKLSHTKYRRNCLQIQTNFLSCFKFYVLLIFGTKKSVDPHLKYLKRKIKQDLTDFPLL